MHSKRGYKICVCSVIHPFYLKTIHNSLSYLEFSSSERKGRKAVMNGHQYTAFCSTPLIMSNTSLFRCRNSHEPNTSRTSYMHGHQVWIRLQACAVSIFSYSVERNVRDTKNLKRRRDCLQSTFESPKPRLDDRIFHHRKLRNLLLVRCASKSRSKSICRYRLSKKH